MKYHIFKGNSGREQDAANYKPLLNKPSSAVQTLLHSAMIDDARDTGITEGYQQNRQRRIARC